MQLSIVKDKYHTKSPWLVVLPARLSSSGKRQYKRFATRAAAADYVASIKQAARRNGEKAHALLPAALAADAAAAAELLAGYGLSLCEAVRQLIGYISAQGVASAQALCSGGTGANAPNIPPAAAPLSGITLNAISERYTETHPQNRPSTILLRKTTLRAVLNAAPHLTELSLEQIDPEMLQQALDAAYGHSPSCWNSARRTLHTLYSYAIKRRLVRIENPVSALDMQHVAEQEITALPPADLRALFAAATDKLRHLRAYIALCAFAGIRPTECVKLRWQDVSFTDSIISIRRKNAKTGGVRHIEMQPTLRAWLLAERPADYKPEALITKNASIYVRLTELRKRAGFGEGGKEWQNDCLRHSYATYYLKAQCGTISQLQFNMGHAGTQLIYARYMNMAGVTSQSAAEWWSILPE